jgi:hypothetical protein
VVNFQALAVATGQAYRPAPGTMAALHELVGQLGPQARRMGVFAEPVPADADLPELDRLLCHTGRDPAWSPTA